jgi:hypothetical protein
MTPPSGHSSHTRQARRILANIAAASLAPPRSRRATAVAKRTVPRPQLYIFRVYVNDWR